MTDFWKAFCKGKYQVPSAVTWHFISPHVELFLKNSQKFLIFLTPFKVNRKLKYLKWTENFPLVHKKWGVRSEDLILVKGIFPHSKSKKSWFSAFFWFTFYFFGLNSNQVLTPHSSLLTFYKQEEIFEVNHINNDLSMYLSS